MKALLKPIKARVTQLLRSRITNNSLIDDEVIIIHSPFKTGTTTIGGALVLMGYAKEDHGYHRNLHIQYKKQMDRANDLALNCTNFEQFKLAHGNEVKVLLQDLFITAKGYKIFGDIPFGHIRIHPFVKKLFMPKAKFIWINREEEAWFNSAKKWHFAHPEIYKNAHTKWQENPEKEKRKLRKMRDDGYKEFLKLQNDFLDDCLVISLEDANWKPLSDFLDIPVPQQEFPVLNKARL